MSLYHKMHYNISVRHYTDCRDIMSSVGSLYGGARLKCALIVQSTGTGTSITGKNEFCRSTELMLGRNEFAEPVLQADMGKVGCLVVCVENLISC